jgi:hypothetical protein
MLHFNQLNLTNMKINRIFRNVTILILGGLILSSCTNLDEELYGRLTPQNYYKTEEEALSSLAGCYEYMAYMSRAGGDGWRIGEYGTDELYCPGRANGGWYDEYVNQIMEHKCTPDNDRLNTCWNTYIFPGIGADNAVLEAMQSSPVANTLKGPIAETRALRAYEYYYAMDYFGNVPVFTSARPDAGNMPKTTARSDVYKFIINEFLAAAKDLPSAKDVTASYYPRLTKEAVYTLLASVYLNAEVYTGTAHWEDVITMCDKVINSGAYSLAAHVGDCFRSTNEGKCPEVIIAFSVDPTKNVDGNQFILYTQHAVDKKKYNLPFAPACGYCFSDEALNWYNDPSDDRLNLLEYGPQYYLDGTPIDNPDIAGDQQLVLTSLKSKTAAQNWEGYRVLKYSPVGATFSGSNADNDYVAERYSNVLLMKAEALFRLSKNTDEALRLVNQVRERSNCPDWKSLSLDRIEKERAREFIWENQRRRDMIRFGSYFTEKTFYSDGNTEKWRDIYPIPAKQINANPALKQNPNY